MSRVLTEILTQSILLTAGVQTVNSQSGHRNTRSSCNMGPYAARAPGQGTNTARCKGTTPLWMISRFFFAFVYDFSHLSLKPQSLCFPLSRNHNKRHLHVQSEIVPSSSNNKHTRTNIIPYVVKLHLTPTLPVLSLKYI